MITHFPMFWVWILRLFGLAAIAGVVLVIALLFAIWFLPDEAPVFYD
jgi:hypothetical protein